MPQFIAAERITVEPATPRAAWRATISKPVTPRAATDFKRYGFKQEYGFQERRLLRAKISLPPDHYIPPCPSKSALLASSRLLRGEISLCFDLRGRTRHAARRDAFKHDTAFKRDYYAVKSHYVPIIASRLALTNPQSRHLLDIFKIIAFEIITQ